MAQKKVDVGYYFKNLRRDELATVLQNFQHEIAVKNEWLKDTIMKKYKNICECSVIFAEIVKVLQSLNQSHGLVEQVVQQISPLASTNILPIKHQVDTAPKGVDDEKTQQFFAAFKLFCRILSLWNELNDESKRGTSGSPRLLKKFIKVKSQLAKTFNQKIASLLNSPITDPHDRDNLQFLYLLVTLDMNMETRLFSGETSPVSALKVIISGLEEKLNTKAEQNEKIEDVVLFEQKLGSLINSYYTEEMWEELKEIIGKILVLSEFDLETKPFKELLENTSIKKHANNAKEVKAETGTYRRIEKAFCNYLEKVEGIEKLQLAVKVVLDIIDKNGAVLKVLYEESQLGSFRDSVSHAVIDQFKKLVTAEVQNFLKEVPTEIPKSEPNQTVIHYHGSNTAKLCGFHKVRQNIMGQINSLTRSISELIRYLQACSEETKEPILAFKDLYDLSITSMQEVIEIMKENVRNHSLEKVQWVLLFVQQLKRCLNIEEANSRLEQDKLNLHKLILSFIDEDVSKLAEDLDSSNKNRGSLRRKVREMLYKIKLNSQKFEVANQMEVYKELYIIAFTDKIIKLTEMPERKDSLLPVAVLYGINNVLDLLVTPEKRKEQEERIKDKLNGNELVEQHKKELEEIKADLKVFVKLGLEPF